MCRAAVKESKLCPLIFVDSFLERIKTFFDDAERSMFDERLNSLIHKFEAFAVTETNG